MPTEDAFAVLYLLADRRFREQVAVAHAGKDPSALDDALDVEVRVARDPEQRRRDVQAAVNALGGETVGR